MHINTSANSRMERLTMIAAIVITLGEVDVCTVLVFRAQTAIIIFRQAKCCGDKQTDVARETSARENRQTYSNAHAQEWYFSVPVGSVRRKRFLVLFIFLSRTSGLPDESHDQTLLTLHRTLFGLPSVTPVTHLFRHKSVI